jgi:hypothetical protein
MASPLALTGTSPVLWHGTCVSFSNGVAPRKASYVAQSRPPCCGSFVYRPSPSPSSPLSVRCRTSREELTRLSVFPRLPSPVVGGHAAFANGSIREDREDRICHFRLDEGALKHVPRELPDGTGSTNARWSAGSFYPLQAHERETVATVSSIKIWWHASIPYYMHSSLHALLTSFEIRHGG